MMGWMVLLGSLFIAVLDGSSQAMASAFNAYEARDFPAALKFLDALSTEGMPQWQQDALNYDKGTVELSLGRIDRALELLRRARGTQDPLLQKRVRQNIAVAYWLRAHGRGESSSRTAYQEKINDLHRVIAYAEEVSFVRAAEEALTRLGAEKGAIQERDTPFSQDHDSPSAFLTTLIDEQQHAVRLAELADEVPLPAFNVLAKKTQERVFLFAAGFPEFLYAWQRKEFKESGTCQCKPWESVVPLVEEGANLAAKAARREDSSGALFYAQEALEMWNRALRLLEKPLAQKDSTSSKNQEETQKSSADRQDLLRLLQQMQQDDREPKKTIQRVEGVRPW